MDQRQPIAEIRSLVHTYKEGGDVYAEWKTLEGFYGRQGVRDLLWVELCAKFLDEKKAEELYDRILAAVKGEA